MRYQDIKRKLIIETSVILAVLSCFSGCTYFLTTVSDDFTQKKNMLDSQLASTTNEKRTLEEKYSRLQKHRDLYDYVLAKQSSDQLYISRQLLRKKVNEFKPRYFLNDLSVTMTPAQELAGAPYRYGTGVIVSSDLTVNFDALTDEDVYSLMQAIEDEFPGAIKMTKFSISRQQKVTDDSLRAIARNGQYSMVKGAIEITWFGIKSFDASRKEP